MASKEQMIEIRKMMEEAGYAEAIRLRNELRIHWGVILPVDMEFPAFSPAMTAAWEGFVMDLNKSLDGEWEKEWDGQGRLVGLRPIDTVAAIRKMLPSVGAFIEEAKKRISRLSEEKETECDEQKVETAKKNVCHLELHEDRVNGATSIRIEYYGGGAYDEHERCDLSTKELKKFAEHFVNAIGKPVEGWEKEASIFGWWDEDEQKNIVTVDFGSRT